MEYREKLYNKLGVDLEPVTEKFRLSATGQAVPKHKCRSCTLPKEITRFNCYSCVNKCVEQAHETIAALDNDRKAKEKQVTYVYARVQEQSERKKQQANLQQKLERLHHLREYIQKQKKMLRDEEQKLYTTKKKVNLRLKTLEDTQRSARDKWENVRSRVPQASRKISGALKVRRETLRGLLKHTVREVDKLYPIRKLPSGKFYTIARLPLPARLYRDNLTKQAILDMRRQLMSHVGPNHILLENLSASNAKLTLDPIFAALGYVVLLCNLLSHYLAIPLPYKMRFRGCHSYIEDLNDVRHGLHLPRHRSNLFADEDDQFQLVHRAIKLLDHNIRHLCLKCSLDRRRLYPLAILPNLHTLCEFLRSENLSDSRVLTAQDREIFHPFSAASSNSSGMLRVQHDSDEEETETEEDDFVVVQKETDV